MDIKQRRKALADALTAHDVAAVKSLLDPSFVVRGADGVAIMSASELETRLPAFFSSHPEYKQSVEIESSRIDGDTAILATRRIETLHVLWWPHAVSSRWSETWKRTDGQWVLTAEKPNPS